MTAQPWIRSARADGCFILAPAFLVTLAVLAFPASFSEPNEVQPWMWLLLIVGIDVAHVYSTLYRSYFDPEDLVRYRILLWIIPFGCWVAGVLLYSIDGMLFWRVLAYVAVFHFVRQQYGFFRLYARRESHSPWSRRLDSMAIYAATLYPLLYWHVHPRSFQWFVRGDFAALPMNEIESVGRAIYVAVLLAYAIKEIRASWRARSVNLPKQMILVGTALSWYVGIVAFDGDLTFTVTNVVAHGVPYIALIWLYQRNRQAGAASQRALGYRRWWFRPVTIPLFLGVLLLLAYAEEGLWAALIWREHLQYYPWLSKLPQIGDTLVLALIVPLLAVPQATHYVLDGFIWRVRDVFAAPGPETGSLGASR